MDALLSLRDAAKLLAVSESWLWKNTLPRGAGVRPVKLGRTVRYDPRDLREFIDRQRAAECAGQERETRRQAGAMSVTGRRRDDPMQEIVPDE
jgi:predicted DNA-binding transcriptional regulator AlpA